MRKVDLALKDLPVPRLEGPQEAEVTLIGWGSTTGVIREAVALLAEEGVVANHLQIKYLHPFHSSEVTEILRQAKRTICVECNYDGQFARHLRAETGFSVGDLILKYDGEPFEPRQIVDQVKAILAGKARELDLTLEEARETAYHYTRVHLADKARPTKLERINGEHEPVWLVEMSARDTGAKQGELRIGAHTGSIYSWQPFQKATASTAD